MSGQSIAVVQPVVPDYRVPLFAALKQKYGTRFVVYAGGDNQDGTIRMDPRAKSFVRLLTNRDLVCGAATWQSGYRQELLSASLVILPGSLRFVSAMWLALRRRQLRKPTILWGHAMGAVTLAKPFREMMFRLPDGYIAYTELDSQIIRKARRDERVWVANNSCVWRNECESIAGCPVNTVMVGRLVAEKKPTLLLEAFAVAVAKGLVPSAAQLVFVGDGPLRPRLAERASQLGIPDRVCFTGHVSERKALSAVYADALVAVSAGYVGLSVIQAFAAGVPMLVSRTERHSPEIEACDESFNTVFFQTDSVESLVGMLSAVYDQKELWRARREAISLRVAGRYTYDAMCGAFESAIEHFLSAPLTT